MARLVLGLLLFATGAALASFRWDEPATLDGGVLLVCALMGFGLYFAGTGLDQIKGQK